MDTSIAALINTDKDKDISSDGASESSNQTDSSITVTNSLAADVLRLSAEKSRVEASFQNDKKRMRQEIAAKDKEIRELAEKLKNVAMTLEAEKENSKAKLISFDRRLTDERHLKENLETQLNQLKTQFSQTSNSDKVIKDMNQELIDTKRKLKAYESNQSKIKDESDILQNLERETEELKQQHIANIMVEKQRVSEANEKSIRLTELHEERVRILETRLSELSSTVANYHNMREIDQRQILQLKDKIAELTKNPEQIEKSLNVKSLDVHSLVEEIERLKHLLIYENTKLEHPIDLSSVCGNGDDAAAAVSIENFTTLRHEVESLKNANDSLKLQVANQNDYIQNLLEQLQVLNKKIEQEITNKSLEVNTKLKAERVKWQDTIRSIEIEQRSKVSQLEQQIQKQRERSLVLLEEKENEIRSLKTSFELFIPKHISSSAIENGEGHDAEGNVQRRSSASHQLGVVLNHTSYSASNPSETHMIYFSNELARKELELSGLRKAKREAESLIRQTLQEKIMLQEKLDDRIVQLEQQVDR